MILRKLPPDKKGKVFSEVLALWESGTAVLLGGGESLSRDQIERVAAARAAMKVLGVIAVNDAYLWAPFADVCYFADSHWWRWHTEGVAKPRLNLTAAQVREAFAAFKGQRCSIQNSGDNIADAAVHIMQLLHYPRRTNDLSVKRDFIGSGSNSGFQAINLAVLAGAKRILLLGFDGRGGHWHGSHPRPDCPSNHEEFRKAFSAIERPLAALGVEVINCSPGTFIDSFPKRSLDQVLQ